jgi:ABC-2 type transport system ATP-binding protein
VSTVEVRGLKREFKGKKTAVALAGVDLDAREGEVFGLLGPNGAGKTTLIRILTTLLLPTSGTATVGGFDVINHPEKVRPIIGVASGSERAGYDFVSARGNLWFFSQLYGLSTEAANQRIAYLAQSLGLTDYLDRKMYMLSTGYRQRFIIARGLINDPKVVFMDEPTSGLDVMTARSIREFIRNQALTSKRTVFLATHNMLEGETICDRVAIIDKGRILACDTPAALKRQVGIPSFVMEITPSAPVEFLSGMRGITGVTSTNDTERDLARVKLLVDDETAGERAMDAVSANGLKVVSSWRQEPTLEEVFVKFVGRGFVERDAETSE